MQTVSTCVQELRRVDVTNAGGPTYPTKATQLREQLEFRSTEASIPNLRQDLSSVLHVRNETC